jgi:drug/metabolite transporter (DMT)-like permease
MPALSKSRVKAYSFLLLNTALWGFAAPIIKYSLNFTTPAQFLFYRYLIATLIFFPIFLVHRSRTSPHAHKTNFRWLVILALLGTPLTLLPLFYGLQATTSIEASILESSSPIFTILGSIIILKEVLKPREWFGLTIALGGTLLLAFEPFLIGHPLTSLSIKGNILVVVSDIIWATFLIFSKKINIDPIKLTFTSFVLSIPFFLIMVLVEKTGFTLANQAVPGILFMAIGGSIIAFWAYQEGQRLIEASEAAIFSYLKPAFSIPLSIIWLREPFSSVTVLATVVIITGVYLSEKR